jgi:hypothetical protein
MDGANSCCAVLHIRFDNDRPQMVRQRKFLETYLVIMPDDTQLGRRLFISLLTSMIEIDVKIDVKIYIGVCIKISVMEIELTKWFRFSFRTDEVTRS